MLDLSIFAVLVSICYAMYLFGYDTIFGTSFSSAFGLHHVMSVLILAELVAMVNKYITSHEIPVEFMGYLVITAIARHIAVDISTMDMWAVLVYSISIFVLIVAISIYKYCIFQNIFKNKSLLSE
jgi:phosphate starvation-inducible membrane PsiE